MGVRGLGPFWSRRKGSTRCRRKYLRVGARGTQSSAHRRGDGSDLDDGGPASRAALSSPFGVAVDSHDNVYVSDTDNQRIRRIDAATGLIRTIVGNGTVGFGGNGGAATAASLARPHRVVPAPNGDLYVGDSFNHGIRRVDARTGVTVEVVEHPAGGADFERLVDVDASRAAIERALGFLISHLR